MTEEKRICPLLGKECLGVSCAIWEPLYRECALVALPRIAYLLEAKTDI